MTRPGYFATVIGGHAAGERLRPPRRIFAREPVLLDSAPDSISVRAAAKPSSPVPAIEAPPLPVAPTRAGRTIMTPPRHDLSPAPAAASASGRHEPRAPSGRRQAPPSMRPLTPARPEGAVHELDRPRAARKESPTTAVLAPPRRPAAPPSEPLTGRARRRGDEGRQSPQVHIGAIEVTVVPPPAPPAAPLRRPPRSAAPGRVQPRPVRGPDAPSAWLGLAQR